MTSIHTDMNIENVSLGVTMHTCMCRRYSQEDQEVRGILGCLANVRSAWNT